MSHARRPEEGEGAKLAQSMDLYAVERLEIGRARLPDSRDGNFMAAVAQLPREHVRLDLRTSDERRVVVRRDENSSHDFLCRFAHEPQDPSVQQTTAHRWDTARERRLRTPFIARQGGTSIYTMAHRRCSFTAPAAGPGTDR